MNDRPDVIIHMPDYYEGSPKEKWKDRYMGSAGTAAVGLVRYLNWPGDRFRFTREQHPDLGQFGVYRYDAEATAALRAEMLGMKPEERWGREERNRVTRSINMTFVNRLRETIVRVTGAS